MNKILAAALVSAVLAISITNSSAEEVDKQYSLDFLAPGSGGGYPTIGGRLFLSEDTAIEVTGNLQVDGKDDDRGRKGGTQLTVSGGMMQYLDKGTVSPYLHAGAVVELYFGDRYDKEHENEDNDVGAYAGIGAEFMITEELSLRTSVNAILGISPFKFGTSTSDLTLSFLF